MTDGRGGRDRRELLLVAMVAGGAAAAAVGVPSFIMIGGHTGAEFVYIAAAFIGPFVFAGAAVIALLVYGVGARGVGRRRVPHAVLAVITAVIVGGLSWLASTLIVGLISAYMTAEGALVATPTVFVALVLTVSLRRRRLRMARTRGVAWEPWVSLASTVWLAALAAGVAPVIGTIVSVYAESVPFSGPGPDVAFFAVLGALPSVACAAWSVLVVLLVDAWVGPRALRATAAGLLTAGMIAVPALVLGGGLEFGGQAALLGLLSGVSAGLVVSVCERRVAPSAHLDATAEASPEQPSAQPR